MTRISIPEFDDAPAASKPILDAFNRQFGFTPNIFRVLSLSPRALAGWAGLQNALAKTLDSETRDGIALAVSQTNSCLYCLSAYTTCARNVSKLDPEEVSRNRQGTSSDPKRYAALNFAKKVVETSGKLTETDLDTVRQAGFTDANIVEIIALSAQCLLTNLINNVFETPIDFPVAPPQPASA
ncbi:peroxidase-related enzyme [Paraburkholderia caledonica]|jgi:uncharacterized peroxidase-related enzyme|uniref:carboxymuconolactone decarboxylase family protein n=1 Tax=Paraburkholderia caledonica TaxID=134536 RepID=UPI0038B74C3C